MPVNFGTAYTLGQGEGNNYDYLRGHTWEIQIGTLDTVLLAKSVKIPQTKVDVGELYHANERVHYPKMPAPSTLDVDFYDAINPSIVAELDAWFNQIYNPANGQMQFTSNIKQQAQIFLYDPEWNLIRTWIAQGIFPLHAPVPSTSLDYSAQDPVVISMSFSCDRIYQSSVGPTSTTGNQTIG
jgi:hypothetical protein